MNVIQRGRPKETNRDPIGIINAWREDLYNSGKKYEVSKRMRIRNKITALISREKNREKIEFLENMIIEKDK